VDAVADDTGAVVIGGVMEHISGHSFGRQLVHGPAVSRG
jgi:hypothetical protein